MMRAADHPADALARRDVPRWVHLPTPGANGQDDSSGVDALQLHVVSCQSSISPASGVDKAAGLDGLTRAAFGGSPLTAADLAKLGCDDGTMGAGRRPANGHAPITHQSSARQPSMEDVLVVLGALASKVEHLEGQNKQLMAALAARDADSEPLGVPRTRSNGVPPGRPGFSNDAAIDQCLERIRGLEAKVDRVQAALPPGAPPLEGAVDDAPAPDLWPLPERVPDWHAAAAAVDPPPPPAAAARPPLPATSSMTDLVEAGTVGSLLAASAVDAASFDSVAPAVEHVTLAPVDTGLTRLAYHPPPSLAFALSEGCAPGPRRERPRHDPFLPVVPAPPSIHQPSADAALAVISPRSGASSDRARELGTDRSDLLGESVKVALRADADSRRVRAELHVISCWRPNEAYREDILAVAAALGSLRTPGRGNPNRFRRQRSQAAAAFARDLPRPAASTAAKPAAAGVAELSAAVSGGDSGAAASSAEPAAAAATAAGVERAIAPRHGARDWRVAMRKQLAESEALLLQSAPSAHASWLTADSPSLPLAAPGLHDFAGAHASTSANSLAAWLEVLGSGRLPTLPLPLLRSRSASSAALPPMQTPSPPRRLARAASAPPPSPQLDAAAFGAPSMPLAFDPAWSGLLAPPSRSLAAPASPQRRPTANGASASNESGSTSDLSRLFVEYRTLMDAAVTNLDAEGPASPRGDDEAPEPAPNAAHLQQLDAHLQSVTGRLVDERQPHTSAGPHDAAEQARMLNSLAQQVRSQAEALVNLTNVVLRLQMALHAARRRRHAYPFPMFHPMRHPMPFMPMAFPPYISRAYGGGAPASSRARSPSLRHVHSVRSIAESRQTSRIPGCKPVYKDYLQPHEDLPRQASSRRAREAARARGGGDTPEASASPAPVERKRADSGPKARPATPDTPPGGQPEAAGGDATPRRFAPFRSRSSGRFTAPAAPAATPDSAGEARAEPSPKPRGRGRERSVDPVAEKDGGKKGQGGKGKEGAAAGEKEGGGKRRAASFIPFRKMFSGQSAP